MMLGRYIDGEHTAFSSALLKTDADQIKQVLVLALGFAYKEQVIRRHLKFAYI